MEEEGNTTSGILISISGKFTYFETSPQFALHRFMY